MKTWPTKFLPTPDLDDPELSGNVVTGGLSISGQSQATRSDGGGLWRWSFNRIWLRTPDLVRAWRAMKAHLKDGGQAMIVPYCDLRHAPRPLVDGVPLLPSAGVPHDDDSYFSDGAGYASDLIEAEAVGAVALRAVTMTVQMTVGEPLRGGEFFTIVHAGKGPRLYLVEEANDIGGGLQTITFCPNLREAIDNGTPLDFDNPRCVMRSVRGSMGLKLVNRTGFGSVSFIESFSEPAA
ncbi:MAG: hypothetical protein GC145_06250 [Caulobacter sp.]|nr:hypothetical protein [Caulobacter sp.]